jgi:AcrR family transcriptional regulator
MFAYRPSRAVSIEVPCMKSLREEHAQATRDAILAAARKLFTAEGYDSSSIDEIAAAARVTSGALYHHFRNKREIMHSVFAALEAELKDRVAAAGGGAKSATEAMRQSLRALFDACLEDDIRSIVFEQAPRVLGWEDWRKIDAEYATGLLLGLFSRLRQEQKMGSYDHNVLASLFLAALAEAGLQIARNRNSLSLRRQCEKILEAFLRGLADR